MIIHSSIFQPDGVLGGTHENEEKIGNLETENAKLKKEVEILSKGFPGLLGLSCARKILDADCQCLFIRKIAIPEYLRTND